MWPWFQVQIDRKAGRGCRGTCLTGRSSGQTREFLREFLCGHFICLRGQWANSSHKAFCYLGPHHRARKTTHTVSFVGTSHPPHSRRKFTKLLGHRASFPIVGFPPSLAGRFSFPLKGVFFFHCGRFSERGFFHCGHFSFSINYRHSTESIYGRASTRKPEKVGYLSFTLSYIQTHSLSLSLSLTHAHIHTAESKHTMALLALNAEIDAS